MIQANNPKSIMVALHEFGPAPGAKAMMERELVHAKEAIDCGLYITFSSPKSECFRVGSQSLCLCGHLFGEHSKASKKGRLDFPCGACTCKQYHFMFRRPEEQGLWWLVRRKGFDVGKWRATCKCKHNHEAHDPNTLKCMARCGCYSFLSEFPCLVCDKNWEEHEVLVETREERLAAGKSVDEAYLPLAKNPEIQREYARKTGKLAITGADADEEDKEGMGHLGNGLLSLNITPEGMPGAGRGAGVEVQIQLHRPGVGTRGPRPKQVGAGRAERSVRLMEKASGPLGGYSAVNKMKGKRGTEAKKAALEEELKTPPGVTGKAVAAGVRRPAIGPPPAKKEVKKWAKK